MLLLVFSCNERKDENNINSSLEMLTFSENFRFLDSCDVEPVPDSILQNEKNYIITSLSSLLRKYILRNLKKNLNQIL